MYKRFKILLYVLLYWATCSHATKHTESELTAFLKNVYEKFGTDTCTESNEASWQYETDITEEHSHRQVEVTLKISNYSKHLHDEWFKDAVLDEITDHSIRRQVKMLKNIGSAALDEADLTKLTQIENNMTNIYSTAKICPFTKQKCDLKTEGLNLEPEITQVMASSRNYDELEYTWKAWRDASGAMIRDRYNDYVELSNKAARANGYKDNGDMWRSDYETPNFIEDIGKLWAKVEPLYIKLHAYTRNKLVNEYGIDKIGTDGLIPANLLGNMWAQSWNNLANILIPYPNRTGANITAALHQQGFNAHKMFETSDSFYRSLGLPTNNMSYGPDSMIEKPNGKEVLCHASAWDFCNKKTYRIKMCTVVNGEDFITIHHEMGHIQYFIQYNEQPYAFRSGANPGFHEAIGDTMALSVSTPQHLQKIGLLQGYQDSDEASVNALMKMALEKVAFLPFGLLIDKWRWDVFSGIIHQEEWNKKWWEYREKYQKLKPPVSRSEHDFDPGAKFHVAGDSQYMNYFVAHILQFQLYRGLCVAAGQYNPETKDPPLHKCDFYKSTEAGKRLHAGLSLGSSKHWSEVLKLMTGETDLDASAVLDYFEPLSKYFDEHHSKASGSGNMLVKNVMFAIAAFLLYALQ